MGVPDEVEYLLGSDRRIRILEALGERPKRQVTIARECSIAPSTVHRNVAGLDRRGWVREDDDRYALTAAGERILSAYRRFAETAERLGEYEPLLRSFEDVDVSVPTEAVVGGDLVTATPSDPHAPAVAMARLMRTADVERIRVVASIVSPITNAGAEGFLSDGRTIEMVVDRETMVSARESYFENYAHALASDRVDLHVSPDPVEFSLVLAGDEVGVGGDPDADPSACLVGSDDDLRAWAEDVYRDVRSGAGRIDVKYPRPDRVREIRQERDRTAVPGSETD